MKNTLSLDAITLKTNHGLEAKPKVNETLKEVMTIVGMFSFFAAVVVFQGLTWAV